MVTKTYGTSYLTEVSPICPRDGTRALQYIVQVRTMGYAIVMADKWKTYMPNSMLQMTDVSIN